MNISQIGSDPWQSLLAALDPATKGQSNAAGNSDPFADLLQSSQAATAASIGTVASGSSSGLAMLQSLLGTTTGTTTSDPLLQALQGMNGTTANDPLFSMLDSVNTANGTDDTENMFNSNFAMMAALQGANAFAGNDTNSLAMLQALNNYNSTAAQTVL